MVVILVDVGETGPVGVTLIDVGSPKTLVDIETYCVNVQAEAEVAYTERRAAPRTRSRAIMLLSVVLLPDWKRGSQE